MNSAPPDYAKHSRRHESKGESKGEPKSDPKTESNTDSEIDQSAKKRVIFVANTDWYLYNFRRSLIESVELDGYDVLLVSPQGEYVERLKELGFRWAEVDFGGRRKSPATNAKAFSKLAQLYRQEKPDLVHHFTIKCVLFGGIAARFLRIPCINAVSGLGHLYTDNRLINRLLRGPVRLLYRLACNSRKARTIFQNLEDRNYFLKKRIAKPERVELIRGSGANCDLFRPPKAPRRSGIVRILFASRLLREKGIFELVEAAQMMRRGLVDFELVIAGDVYEGNPSSLTSEDLLEISHHATLLGHVDSMADLITDADIVVLPSYAEGTPRILLEAGACGKPLVATDIAGCRGVVEDGVNGFLVPPKNVERLAAALQRLVEDEGLRVQFGKESRRLIETNFCESSVVQRTKHVYADLV